MGTKFNPNQSTYYTLLSELRFHDKYITNTLGITSLGSYLNSIATSDVFGKLFNSPQEYIVSVRAYPFDLKLLNFGTVSNQNLYLGNEDTGVEMKKFDSIKPSLHLGNVDIKPKYGYSYLDYTPYTKITMYIPPFGSIPINTNFLEVGKHIYSPVYIDHITGLSSIRISLCPSANNLSDTNIVAERTSQLGVPVSVSQIMQDYLGSLTSLGGSVGSLLTGNFMGALNGIVSAVDTQSPSVSTIGANGSIIETIMPAYMLVEHLKLANEDNTEFGRPLCEVRTLGNLSGYIECAEDDHAFNCTMSEREQINGYLKSGFFYE